MKRTFEIDLLIGGYSHTITDDLKNWDDVKLSFERSDYAGVIKSFSTKFEFAGISYRLLLDEYLTNYLTSSASVVVYTINNSRLRSEKFRCALDFSTLEDDGSTISINAIDNTLASIIKSKKSTVYDIPVSDIKMAKPLLYDRLIMENMSNWTITGSTDDSNIVYNDFLKGDSSTAGLANYSYPIYTLKTEIVTKNSVEVVDVGYEKIGANLPDPFIKNVSESPISISFSMQFMFSMALIDGAQTTPSFMTLWRTHDTRDYSKLKEDSIIIGDNTFSFSQDIILQPREGISFGLYANNNIKISHNGDNSENTIYLDFKGRGTSYNIDIINPLSLLSSLIQNIYGSPVDCSIPLNGRLLNTVICAAESLRGLDNAKIHTSYSKFIDFMSAEFGYVPVIGSNIVSFVHRDTLFINQVIKSFGTDHSEFKFNVEASLIYSSVKVGYDKVDYDSINGRDEFRFTNEFTTGKTLTDNLLSLISPYRADAYGIEFLVNKRGEDTTDDQSDNDVFIIGAIQDANNYYLDRTSSISGVLNSDTMFNASFSPKAMLIANEAFIGVCAELLIFSSTEGNGDVTINGVSEKDNLTILNRLFRAEKTSINLSDLDIPSDLTKAVDFVKNGRKYRGFIMGIDYNITKDSPVTYNLLIQGIYDENS